MINSAPILRKIQRHLQHLSCLPKSTLGQARSYTFGLWTQLPVFLDHGGIPLDNNRVENIRTAGSDPFACLKDVLTRIPAMTNPQGLRPLLPRNWLAERSAQNAARSDPSEAPEL